MRIFLLPVQKRIELRFQLIFQGILGLEKQLWHVIISTIFTSSEIQITQIIQGLLISNLDSKRVMTLQSERRIDVTIHSNKFIILIVHTFSCHQIKVRPDLRNR